MAENARAYLDRQRVGECPLTARQLQAYRAYAAGMPPREIARDLRVAVSGAEALLTRGAWRLGVVGREAALEVLIDAGWLSGEVRDGPSSAAARYLMAFDAYLQAPREERDQMLVRDLCNDALDELLSRRS